MIQDTTSTINFGRLATEIIFYIFIAAMAFFSITTIFVLIKRANSRTVAVAASVAYALIFLYFISRGINLLGTIQ